MFKKGDYCQYKELLSYDGINAYDIKKLVLNGFLKRSKRGIYLVLQDFKILHYGEKEYISKC